MSLSSIKAKEVKGKQTVLPKLKTILANPSKTKCPVLNDEEMEDLKLIFQKAMENSDLQPRKYATAKGISLGLESCLRNINNKKSSCVFISLSIKPSHIVSLIARNAEIKDETQPVFAQPKLENFTEQLFGVKALCMVLPNDLLNVSKDLDEWVGKRKKPKKIISITSKVSDKRKVKKNIKKIKIQKEEKEFKSEEDVKSESEENLAKPFSGDYISFGNTSHSEINQSKLNDDQAMDALTKIMDKIPTALPKSKQINGIEPMEVDLKQDAQIIQQKECTNQDDSDSSDEFLNSCAYQPLTVHKIKGNPNKTTKKKRKKNKTKKLTKQ